MLQMKRRTFLKLAATATAGVAIAPRLASAKISYPANPQGFSVQKPDETKDVKIVRSMCFQCHGRCGTQIKVVGGEVVKIDGNPYDPNCYDYVSPNSPVLESDLDAGPTGKDLGSLCVKGLAGVYTLYNPRRLQHPIKRAGKKGERKWKRISWDDAYKEIVDGGDLFGEGSVQGLKAIMSDAPIDATDSKYMDEAPPTGYGPKRNLFSWTRGRDQMRDLTRARFCTGFGTSNVTSHYTVCETTRNETLGNMGADGSPDFFGATYIILAGSSIYDAEFPMQTKLRHFSKWFARRPGTKAVYIGPRQGKVCASGAEWVPIKTGTDCGFFMGMAKYIIENKLYDAKHLSAPNEAVAKGQQTYTSMTYLVKKAEPRTYLTDAAGNNQVLVGGKVVLAKDATTSADLEGSTADADTLFTLIKQRMTANSFDAYNDFCEIPRGTIERIAKEFTSAEKPVADCYKGPAQHSNGYYNILALGIVNILTNRLAQPGGLTGGGGYYAPSAPKGTAEPKLSGVLLGCSGSGNYAGSKASATRPWIPLGIGKNDGTWQEEYAGMSIGYPYQPKALMMFTANPVISNPRGAYYGTTALQRIPLVIAVDPFMNEASMQSDYVLPDTTYLENWSYYSATGATKSKRTAFRQPAVGNVEVGKEQRGIYPDVKTAAQIHIDLGNKLGLPNFGKNADGKGTDIFTDTQYWNMFFNNGDFKGGIDPNAAHMKMGGMFSTKRSDSSLPREKPSLVHGYVSKAATIKNAFNGKYFDPLPKMVWHLDANWDEWKYDKAKYNLLLGTHKDAHHTQSRTAENLWLMSLEPSNGLEINSVDATKIGVKTGDWVEIENTVGEKYKVQAIVTETQKTGYGEIKNSYGRWEHGSRDIAIEGGVSIKGDARVGAGFHATWIWSPDPAIVAKGQDPKTIAPPTEPVFGSATQMGTPVMVRKV